MTPLEYRDYKRIHKLKKLNNIDTFWQDVRKLCKHCTTDHAINAWQRLAEQRYNELKQENNHE